MRLIFGKGINDADYSVSETVQRDGKTVHVWCCPYYRLWKNMFQRCYSEEKNKAYSNSVVDEAWFLFSDFSLWVKSQPQHAWWIEDPRSFELDKDLLGDGCKMYSPKVCVFVPKVLNNFFLLSDGSRGELPVGVSFDRARGKYSSYISVDNRKVFLGRYADPISAHKAWQVEKVKMSEVLLASYTGNGYSDRRVEVRLTAIIKKLKEDISEGKETKSYRSHNEAGKIKPYSKLR